MTVDDVLWSHPQAVTQLSTGEVLTTVSGDGFDTVNGEKVAVVVDGHTRMDIGSEYIVTFVDDVLAGDQVLEYMDGSALTAESENASAFEANIENIRPSNLEPENRPERGVPFSERIAQFAVPSP